MTANDIVAELKKLGNAQTKKTWMTHGAQEPCLGVKVEDMKKIQKRVKMDYQLALDLYDTGIADAMYLAGLIADDAKMTRKDLQKSPLSPATSNRSTSSRSIRPTASARSPSTWSGRARFRSRPIISRNSKHAARSARSASRRSVDRTVVATEEDSLWESKRGHSV